MCEDGFKTFHAKDITAWRQWQQKHHATEKSLWLIIYQKASKTPSVTYDEAESYFQFFAKGNPKSN